jgi:hypothetical protein
VYNESTTWATLAPRRTSTPFTVHYETGWLELGRDWWSVTWEKEGDKIGPNSMKLWYSNPTNFRGLIDFLEKSAPTLIAQALKVARVLRPELAPAATVAKVVSKALCEAMLNDVETDGFKQHILREEDEDRITVIRINEDGTINFKSRSGQSDTVYDSKIVELGL